MDAYVFLATKNLKLMFGFIREQDNTVVIANRLFETKMYNLFLSEAELDGEQCCLSG